MTDVIEAVVDDEGVWILDGEGNVREKPELLDITATLMGEDGVRFRIHSKIDHPEVPLGWRARFALKDASRWAKDGELKRLKMHGVTIDGAQEEQEPDPKAQGIDGGNTEQTGASD